MSLYDYQTKVELKESIKELAKQISKNEQKVNEVRFTAKAKIEQLTTNGNNLATQASVWHEVLQIIGE